LHLPLTPARYLYFMFRGRERRLSNSFRFQRIERSSFAIYRSPIRGIGSCAAETIASEVSEIALSLRFALSFKPGDFTFVRMLFLLPSPPFLRASLKLSISALPCVSCFSQSTLTSIRENGTLERVNASARDQRACPATGFHGVCVNVSGITFLATRALTLYFPGRKFRHSYRSVRHEFGANLSSTRA